MGRQKSLAFSFVSGVGDFTLCIAVATNEPFAGADWALYMEGLRNAIQGKPLRTLVLTDGTIPNPAQRKEMVDLFSGLAPPPTCIVSSNQLVRGVTTALSWFNDKIRSVAPENMKEAFAYLGVPAEHEERIWKEIARLRAELPLMKSLARAK